MNFSENMVGDNEDSSQLDYQIEDTSNTIDVRIGSIGASNQAMGGGFINLFLGVSQAALSLGDEIVSDARCTAESSGRRRIHEIRRMLLLYSRMFI
ncbi:hypothetical protein HS088_TW15G01013 [Tripterygium wilfordii]|uniref:Uncharacterized protein n=1 Tax=Tripterygium wilfordii TaxID=458696 RepID=A0A7J7CNL5_TRIWF|nr:hypothetical protein HS088_TW15G01013 [Tripterygium wilfordii]